MSEPKAARKDATHTRPRRERPALWITAKENHGKR
jgi:hypothetical protein